MERYRILEGVAVYFVTFTVVDWLPVFVDGAACSILTESLNFATSHKGLRVNAFVVMPTHFHAIVLDADFDAERLKLTLNDVRKFTGRQLSDFCTTNRPACFGTVLREEAGGDRWRRFWQPTQHPEGIFTLRFWRQKIDYLHKNPCRKGLVRSPEDWRFSSAAYWLRDGASPSDVVLADVEWQTNSGGRPSVEGSAGSGDPRRTEAVGDPRPKPRRQRRSSRWVPQAPRAPGGILRSTV